jgi:hypothetical protein
VVSTLPGDHNFPEVVTIVVLTVLWV